MDDTYEVLGKSNEANVLFYEDVEVIESVDMDDDNYKALSRTNEKLSTTYRMLRYLHFDLNLSITNHILDGRTSTIIGFIDPRNNKKYLKCDGEYYIRRNMINDLFNKHRSPDLIWKNQNYAQIADLMSKRCGFIDTSKLISNLSVEDWNMYKHRNRKQMICRADKDDYFDHHDLPEGTNDIHTFDINKCYTYVGMYRKTKWIVPNMCDTWRDFNFLTDHEIPEGEYELFEAVYGDEKTHVMFDTGPHTHEVIQYLLEIKQISFNDIQRIRPVLHKLKPDTFKSFFNYCYEFVQDLNLPETVAKKLVISYIGNRSKLTFKQNYCLMTQEKHYADASFNLYTNHGFNTQYIDHIDNDLIILFIQKQTPNYRTATPIWNQFIEGGKILLSRTAYYLLHNAPQATILACNTDSITIHKPNQSVLRGARENTEHKKEMAYIGKLKLEETIKIRGKRLSEVMMTEKTQPIEQVVNKPNKLIRADGAGAGKTYTITQ